MGKKKKREQFINLIIKAMLATAALITAIAQLINALK